VISALEAPIRAAADQHQPDHCGDVRDRRQQPMDAVLLTPMPLMMVGTQKPNVGLALTKQK